MGAEAGHRPVPGAVPGLHVGKGSFDCVVSEFQKFPSLSRSDYIRDVPQVQEERL